MLPFNGQNHIWTTREGDRIPVASMTTSHIRNAVRTLAVDDVWVTILNLELETRGEPEEPAFEYDDWIPF